MQIGRRRLVGQRAQSGIEAHARLLIRAEPAQRNRALRRFALADDHQDWDFGKRMFAHLIGDLLIPEIRLDSETRLARRRQNFDGIIVGVLSAISGSNGSLSPMMIEGPR